MTQNEGMCTWFITSGFASNGSQRFFATSPMVLREEKEDQNKLLQGEFSTNARSSATTTYQHKKASEEKEEREGRARARGKQFIQKMHIHCIFLIHLCAHHSSPSQTPDMNLQMMHF